MDDSFKQVSWNRAREQEHDSLMIMILHHAGDNQQESQTSLQYLYNITKWFFTPIHPDYFATKLL